MKDNFHQFDQMVSLAKSMSSHYKTGSAWLYLSACGDLQRNREIISQRLSPRTVIDLDSPDIAFEESLEKELNCRSCQTENDSRLFAGCVSVRRDFHIDPYGQMTFCCFVKDPDLRYDLRKGNFKECWEEFIPSLGDKVRGSEEYLEGCGSCDLRKDCRWCPVFGYLEHRRLSAPVGYLCEVAKENRNFKTTGGKTIAATIRLPA